MAFPKGAEDTESKLLEDSQEVCPSVKTASANTARNERCHSSVVLTLSHTLAFLQELLNSNTQAAPLTTSSRTFGCGTQASVVCKAPR